MQVRRILAFTATALAVQCAIGAEDTIKVGVMLVDSGPLALYMSHTLDGTILAVEQLNAKGGALGRKYELVQQTYNGTPAGAVLAATKLAQQQGVSFIAGYNTSPAVLAISPKLDSLNALLLNAVAQSDELSSKGCQKNFFQLTTNDSMTVNAMRALLKKGNVKTWNLLMPDYQTGHDFARKFTELVVEQGGTVQTTVFAPMSTTDFGSAISQLTAKPAEGLGVVFPGAGGIAFAKQQKQFNLFEKYKVVASAMFTSEMVIDAQGDSTVGVYTPLPYSWEMPGERNGAFVKAFEQRYKRKPHYGDAANFQVYELLNAAIVKANSTDVAAVRAALSGLKTTTILGDVEVRAVDHQLAQQMTVAQVTKAGDGKGVLTMRSVETASSVTPPPSAECKL